VARQRKPKFGIVTLLVLLAVAVFYHYNTPASKPARTKQPTQYGHPKPTVKKAPRGRAKNEVRALKTFTGKVTAIKDGDTFEVLYDGQSERVRLAEIDCPESKQAFGQKAKHFSSDLCFGKTVTVTAGGKRDRYGRVVGTVVTTGGINVNEALVKAGYAWHYKDYSDNAQIGIYEEQARQKQLGLWADKNPTAPWEWRKSRRRK
jgi:endonuclease YncB( thermonuclease family)